MSKLRCKIAKYMAARVSNSAAIDKLNNAVAGDFGAHLPFIDLVSTSLKNNLLLDMRQKLLFSLGCASIL